MITEADRPAGPDWPRPIDANGPATTAGPAAVGHDGLLFALLLAGYPLAWATGLGLVHHLAFGGLMLVWLAARPPLLVSRGTGYLALFLAVAGLSGLGLTSATDLALFALRLSWYAAALLSWLYLAHHRGPASGRRLLQSLVALWVLVVIGGWLSLVVPELGWSTPPARLLPSTLADNDLIARYLFPQVSETQVFRYQDVTLHRPAAPFAYTNGWGSAMALLTPFALAALHDRRIGIPRPVMVGLLLVAAVPFTVALNRGSWLTLGAGIGYGVARWAWVRRDPRPLVFVGLALSIGLAVAASTGILASSTEALATRSADSNETRAGLYVETITETASSPLIGFGSTRPSVTNPDGPPLGTHGQLWAVLFAHGYLGLGLFLGFFLAALVRARAIDPAQHWAKVSLVVGLLQLPIYGHLPHQLFIMVAAAAIATWPPGPIGPRPVAP